MVVKHWNVYGCEFTYTDIQKIKKYVEQKETILDKVTDKLKEDIETYKDSKELTQKEQIELEYAREILNIIEGEKK